MTMQAGPSIAVIVVNYNSGTMLARCLEALSRQTWANFRTIVVDNASADGSADVAEAHSPRVELVRAGGNLGFAAGNNLALRMAGDCDWIALLNPDAFPAPDWLERLAAAAAAHPDFQFFGCLMRAADAPGLLDGTGDVYHVSGFSWRRDHGVAVERAHATPGEIFGPCAAAALYSRAALDEVGGFDESYFCYHEDVDLAFRLRLRGYRCWYEPTAIVDHIGSGISGKRSSFSTYYGHRNLVWTYVKDMPFLLLFCLLPVHLAFTLISFAVCALRGQARILLQAKVDAIKGLGAVWRVRRQIQASRKIGSLELLGVMSIRLRAADERQPSRKGP